jgi:hypothetical protein
VAAIRGRWFRPRYWGWRWRSGVSRESKAISALIGLAAVAAGGYLAADTLGGPSSSTESFETTVEKIVTVREKGKLVRRPARVVRRVFVTTSTAADGTQVITRRVVSTQPVIRREVVTVAGRPRTVVRTRSEVVTRTRTRPVTDLQTVTSQETVTNEELVTVTRPVTTTQTSTVVRTVPTTVTETESVTVTVPITISVSLPVDGE